MDTGCYIKTKANISPLLNHNHIKFWNMYGIFCTTYKYINLCWNTKIPILIYNYLLIWIRNHPLNTCTYYNMKDSKFSRSGNSYIQSYSLKVVQSLLLRPIFAYRTIHSKDRPMERQKRFSTCVRFRSVLFVQLLPHNNLYSLKLVQTTSI